MRLEELKKKIKEDNPYFKNVDIKDYQVLDLMTFNEEKANCKKCSGIDKCLNSKRGFEPFIDGDNNISYSRCRFMLKEEEINKRNSNLNMMYMPKKLLEAKMEDFRLDSDKRIKCMQFAKNFIDQIENKKYAKGAYIFGDTGNGKTFFLSCLTNELIDRGHKVSFVYFPDLINDLKDDFDKLNSKINELKQTEILIIDDFGVGTITGWVRDSIIAPILNYRMSDLKPVLITSNISFDKLGHYLKLKEDRDNIPAARIVRRIDELCEYLELDN